MSGDQSPDEPTPPADGGVAEVAPPIPDADQVPEASAGIPVIVEAADAPTESPEAIRIAELEAKLATIEKEKKDLWDKYVRMVADHENAKKRSKREVDDARAETRTKVLKEMLPVVDNLERAVEHSAQAGEAHPIVEGVRLVLRQFGHAFDRLEVQQIEADGQPFDPNIHEAISQQESDSPPGTVVQVLQRGYRMGDRLLRPAMVVVAKAKTADAAPAEAAEDAE